MKKSIFAVLAVCTACVTAAGISGCKSCNDDEKLSGYDQIQSFLDQNYSKIVLTVTDTLAENNSLVSKYTLNYGENGVTVEYRVEKFSSLSLDAAPDSVKTVKEGTTVIKDGVVVSQSGDSETFSLDLISAGGMNFKEEYFANATLNSISLKADISNPSAFFGTTVACTNMKINAIFLDYMSEMVITYTASSGHSVKYEYKFTPVT